MGFLSIITDTLFGDSGKAASKSKSKENEKNRQFVLEATVQARGDIASIFPQIQASRQGGFDAAKNIFQQFDAGVFRVIRTKSETGVESPSKKESLGRIGAGYEIDSF